MKIIFQLFIWQVIEIVVINCLSLKTRSKMSIKMKTRMKTRSKQKLKQQPVRNAIDGPVAAVNNSEKIRDAQKFDPVLSKAGVGIYPVYPDEYNVSAEGDPVIMMTSDNKGASLLQRHDLDYDEKCVLKQGYLAQVLDSQMRDLSGTNKQFITMRPVFTVLNKQTLTIFENENVQSMLQSMVLTKIKASCRYLKWNATYCWQVIKDDNTIVPQLPKELSDPNLPTENVWITLCATTSAERDSWTSAINEYHQCEIKPVVAVNEGRDFLKTLKDEDEEFEQERNNADDEQILEVSNALDGINDRVRANLNNLQSEEEDMDDKNKDEDIIVDELEDKNNCLQEQLIEEAKQSEENFEFDMEKLLTDQIENELKVDPLKDAYKNRLYRIIQHKKNQLKEKKKAEGDLKAQMMQKTQMVEKNENADSCHSKELITDGQVEMKRVCGNIYKNAGFTLVIKDVLDCLNPKTFCLACCSNFIGQAKTKERNQCIDECKNGQVQHNVNTHLTLRAETKNSVSKTELTYDDETMNKLMEQMYGKKKE